MVCRARRGRLSAAAPGEFGCATLSTSSWLTAGGREALWETATLAGDLDGDGLVGDLVLNTSPARRGLQRPPTVDAAGAIPAAWVLEPVGDVNGDGAMDLAAVGDVRAMTAAAGRDITDIDRVARVYLSRVGTAPTYGLARSVALRLGPRDYWGAGQFTP